MISSLSPLIQLFAAMYLTMCLDNDFLIHFWAPNYSTKIDEAFNPLDMPEGVKQMAVFSTIPLAKSFERRMTKRGVFMLIVSVFLLIIIGFEKGLVTHTGYLGLSCIYILLAFTSAIVFWFDRTFLEGRWDGYLFIFLYIVFYVVLILVVPCFSFYGPLWMQYSYGLKLTAKLLIIITIVLPVVWQFFVNWLYSKYYLDYVISEVSKEVDEYKKALNFDGNHDDIRSIKTCYQNLVVQRLAANNEDKPIEPLLKEFKNEVSKIDFYPISPKLLEITSKERQKEKAESKKNK